MCRLIWIFVDRDKPAALGFCISEWRARHIPISLLNLFESRSWEELKIQHRRKFNDFNSQGINHDGIVINGRLVTRKERTKTEGEKGPKRIYVQSQMTSAIAILCGDGLSDNFNFFKLNAFTFPKELLKWLSNRIDITCVLGSIQFNTTQYYIQYYSILDAYWVVFNLLFVNIHSILLNITCNIE